MIRARLTVLSAIALGISATPLIAQATTSGTSEAATESSARDAAAVAVLEASNNAIANADGFGAQFRMFGEGGALIESTMPSMSGRFIFGRFSDTAVIHMLGEARDKKDGDPYPFDFTRTADKLTWTDDTEKTVFVRKAKPEPRSMPGAARMIHMANMLDAEPFAKLLSIADSVQSEPSQSVAGVSCDVVLVGIRKNSGVSHTNERWFIGKEDRLPRRVEQLTDVGIKFSLITEMSGLQAQKQAPAMLDVRRPEGYRVDDQTVKNPGAMPATKTANPNRIKKEGTQTTRKPTTRPTPAEPTSRPAAMYSFTDEAGTAIDNNSQIGRVTVLYYWGTWCVPCREVSPEISKIAERFANQNVDVFGLAIRERDPQAARDYMSEKNYQHRLVMGAESTVGAFRIRVYPTVVVIDAEGNFAYKGAPSKVRSAEQLAGEIADAIQTALDQSE
ncbi:MAG: TlpA disulfide reductase family protein [Phycisphaerales bacterium]